MVALGPLSVADVEQYLVRGAHDGDPAAVHALSGGLPLLLPVAVGSPGPGLEPAAADVTALVRRLTVSLPQEHVRILEAASLVTAHLDAELAAAAADVDVGTAAAATATALRANLLVQAPDGAGLAFAHELVREALADRLTSDRARAAHRRIAVLGSARPGVPAVRIASHWEAAGPEPDAAGNAATWWARAAAEASTLRAYGDAAAHQSRAAVAAAAAGWRDEEVAGHHLAAAQAWHRAGRYDRAVAAAEQAATLAEAADRPDLMAQAALAVGWVAYPAAQLAIGRLTRTALARHTELDAATRARLVAQQVAALGNYAPARGGDLAAEAMRLARRSGDPTALLEAIGAWMAAQPEIGGADEQRLLAEEALVAATQTDQTVPTLMAHTWRLNAVVQLGRMEAAREELEALRLIAESSRLPLATWHWLRASVALAVFRGDFAVVADQHARATAVARDSGDVVAANVGHAAVFETAGRRGVPLADPERALRTFAQAPSATLIDAPRALVLDQMGRRDEAHAIYQASRPPRGRCSGVPPVVAAALPAAPAGRAVRRHRRGARPRRRAGALRPGCGRRAGDEHRVVHRTSRPPGRTGAGPGRPARRGRGRLPWRDGGRRADRRPPGRGPRPPRPRADAREGPPDGRDGPGRFDSRRSPRPGSPRASAEASTCRVTRCGPTPWSPS